MAEGRLGELAEAMEGMVVRSEAVQAVEAAAAGLRGKGLDWARRGPLGAGWVAALQQMGVNEGHAYEAACEGAEPCCEERSG